MSKETLYNKYRPKTFSDVIGQGKIIASLKSFFKPGKELPHAILFSGIHGTGKTTLARVLAMRVNCENPKDADPCGTCSNCRLFLEEAHPDVVEIDAASQRGIDNIRELKDMTRYKAIRGKNKVFIIDEVHELTTQAVDAILKILEEPPPNLYFFFATTEPYKIKKTFLSRCVSYRLWRVQTSKLLPHLIKICQAEGVEYDDEALREICNIANGSVRDALSLLQAVINIGITLENVYECSSNLNPVVVFDLFSAIVKKDISAFMGKVEDILEQGNSPVPFMNEVLRHLIRILQIQSGVKDLKDRISVYQKEKYIMYADKFDRPVYEGLVSLWKCKPVYDDTDLRIAMILLYNKMTEKESVVKETSAPFWTPKVAQILGEACKKDNEDKLRKYAHWFAKQFKAEVIADSLDVVSFKVEVALGTEPFTLFCVNNLNRAIKGNRYFLLNDIVELYNSKRPFSIPELIQEGKIKKHK